MAASHTNASGVETWEEGSCGSELSRFSGAAALRPFGRLAQTTRGPKAEDAREVKTLGFSPVLGQPLVAEPPEVSRAFQECRQHRHDSREHGNSNVDPYHRRILQELRSLMNRDVTRP
jgi:hypothetical protein